MKGLYALQGGLALPLWERGASSLTELEVVILPWRPTRHLGGFPFVQGSREEGLKVGRCRLIQRMGQT